MEEKIGVVFSWDPRSKTWLKERGPDDAVPPPVAPIDDGAVQTYFLDPSNGKWNPTILGLRARQVSVELKDLYRAPLAPGLAMVQSDRNPRLNVERHDSVERAKFPMRMVAAFVVLVLLIGLGAFGAQAMFGSSSPSLDKVAGAIASAGASLHAPSASARASASPSASASTAASASPSDAPAATQAPVIVRTAPPPPQPRTIRLSVKLPTGTTVYYSGPASAPANSSFQAIFSVVLASGQGGNESLTVYLGSPNGAHTSALAAKPDANGNYVLTIKTSGLPGGDQPLSVIYGTTAGIYTLGSINIQ